MSWVFSNVYVWGKATWTVIIYCNWSPFSWQAKVWFFWFSSGTEEKHCRSHKKKVMYWVSPFFLWPLLHSILTSMSAFWKCLLFEFCFYCSFIDFIFAETEAMIYIGYFFCLKDSKMVPSWLIVSEERLLMISVTFYDAFDGFLVFITN